MAWHRLLVLADIENKVFRQAVIGDTAPAELLSWHKNLTVAMAADTSGCAQICWKWRKVVTAEAQRSNFRAFLDGVQYSRTGILRYERIFGPGFVSTGGLDTTKVSATWPHARPVLSRQYSIRAALPVPCVSCRRLTSTKCSCTRVSLFLCCPTNAAWRAH